MKKVVLAVIVRNQEEAEQVASYMGSSPVAQQGVYTIECGGIYDATKEEIEEVESQRDL